MAGEQAVIAAPLATTSLPSLDFSGLVGPHNAAPGCIRG